MRIASFVLNSSPTAAPRIGALLPGGTHLVDLARAVDPDGSAPPQSEWYDLAGDWFPRASRYYHAHAGTLVGGGSTARPGMLYPLDSVRLLAPVPRPGKIVCIGLNYRDHAAEAKLNVPAVPITFSKYATAVQHPGAPIVLPKASTKVDYEAELAVVIGRKGKGIARERALDHVLGYTNLNDVSARDFQFADRQWQRAKSCDTFAPMGPAIVTADEVPDPNSLRISLRLNGETMQDSSTSEMIFKVDELVAFVSETVTLEPGDVIATGTPAGVGFARTPPVFLKPGDVVEVEIEGLGVLRNDVRAE
jgi:2-keto-4-pentenoate hydratase/2-oxohepta-3-ene-1,7-dioic acid hydratase in catechol pathway